MRVACKRSDVRPDLPDYSINMRRANVGPIVDAFAIAGYHYLLINSAKEFQVNKKRLQDL